jgi:hypothetical protein
MGWAVNYPLATVLNATAAGDDNEERLGGASDP